MKQRYADSLHISFDRVTNTDLAPLVNLLSRIPHGRLTQTPAYLRDAPNHKMYITELLDEISHPHRSWLNLINSTNSDYSETLNLVCSALNNPVSDLLHIKDKEIWVIASFFLAAYRTLSDKMQKSVINSPLNLLHFTHHDINHETLYQRLNSGSVEGYQMIINLSGRLVRHANLQAYIADHDSKEHNSYNHQLHRAIDSTLKSMDRINNRLSFILLCVVGIAAIRLKTSRHNCKLCGHLSFGINDRCDCNKTNTRDYHPLLIAHKSRHYGRLQSNPASYLSQGFFLDCHVQKSRHSSKNE
jgi:hypothetical protein